MISWSPLAQSNFAETTDEIPSGFLSFEFLRFGVATPVFVQAEPTVSKNMT